MTQDQLNRIASPPNPDNFWELELNQTRVLSVTKDGRPEITLTLRKIEGDSVYIQVTYDTRSGHQVSRDTLQ